MFVNLFHIAIGYSFSFGLQDLLINVPHWGLLKGNRLTPRTFCAILQAQMTVVKPTKTS